MMSWNLLLCMLASIIFIQNQNDQTVDGFPMDKNRMVIKRASFTVNEEYLIPASLTLTKPDGLMNLDVYIHSNVSLSNVFVKMSVSKRDHDDMKFKPFLNIVNVTIDYCGYSNKRGVGAFLVNILIQDLTAHGNLLQPCPVRGHLYLRNFQMDLSHVPFFVPTGEYMVHCYAYLKSNGTDVFVWNGLGYAEVIN